MKKHQILLIAGLCTLLLGAGYFLGSNNINLASAFHDPKNAILPENLDDMQAKIGADVKRLSEEDRKLLVQYVIRHGFQKVSEHESQPKEVTLGQAIEEQAQINIEEQQKEAAQTALRTKIEEQRKALEKQVESVLVVSLIDKKMAKESFLEKIELKIGFQNNGDKEISGVKGIAVFRDIFGDEILKMGLSVDESIPVGKNYVWNGYKDFNQFDHSDNKMATTETAKIKFEFQPQMILFKDGSKLAVPEE